MNVPVSRNRGFRIFIILMIILSSTIFLIEISSLTAPKSRHKRFAYAFYITEPEYACYAGVNADRLIEDFQIDQSQIDILFLYTNTDRISMKVLKSCARSEVKLIHVPPAPGITSRDLYAQSYVRFEAFKMTEYDRLIILDADGLIIRSLDHLFDWDLDGKPIVGALVDYLNYDWLSSTLLVVEPSSMLYEKVRSVLTPDGIHQVSLYANGSHYDMDVLNYIFKSGKEAKLIPSSYVTLDSSFVDANRESLDGVHYVHFTARKPLIYVETKRDNEKMNKNARWIYKTFWEGFEKRCKPMFEESVKMALDHVDLLEKESKLDEQFAKFGVDAIKEPENV